MISSFVRALVSRGPRIEARATAGCLRCLLLVMYTYPFEKKTLTLHLARGQGRERYFCCNLMQRKVLASSYQHLMAEAPSTVKPRRHGLSETSGLGTEDEPPGLALPDDVAAILEEGPSLRPASLRPASLRSAVLRSGPSSKIATPVPLRASLCSFIFPFLSALRV